MMEKPRILKSKKSAIPIVNEIVLTFLHITPKPILFLLFILLLGVIGTFVLPSILNLFGYECLQHGSNLELYQVPMSSIIPKTFDDLRQSVRGFAGLSDYQLPEDPFPNNDQKYLRIPNECFVTVRNGTQDIQGYTALCTNCSFVGQFFETTTQSVIRTENSVCTGDGYFHPLPLMYFLDVWAKNYCYRCSPPNPYYFNYSNCYSQDQCFFTITDESLVGSIISESYQADYYYQQIIKLGGVLRPQASSEFVNVQCAGINQPQLYFFSIKIFDTQLWIYLGVAYILIFFAFFWYSLTLK